MILETSLPDISASLSLDFISINSPAKAFRLLLLNKCELLPDAEREELCSSLPKLLRGYDGFAAVSLREDKLFAAAELAR